MELITIKEYCKRENITDAGARKRVSSKLVKSVILEEMLYIVEENNEKKEQIKSLKNRLRNATDRIKLLTAEKTAVINQQEHIKKLEEKVEQLEAKIEALREKQALELKELNDQSIKVLKEAIAHYSIYQLPNSKQ